MKSGRRFVRWLPTLSVLLIGVVVYATPDGRGQHPHPGGEPILAVAGRESPPVATRVSAENAQVVSSITEEPFVHVVEDGDRLTLIASKYNVTTESIMAANAGLDPDVLRVGMHLQVPGATTTAPIVDVPLGSFSGDPVIGQTAGVIAHTVEPGELLIGLAELYGLPADHIIAFNRLDSDRLAVGQRLLIPPATLPVDH